MASESLYDIWAKRNPNWEKRYEENIIKTFTDYGRGASQMQSDRGKLFGAGYEIFILAFFIGLYYDEKRKLVEDGNKIKSFGQPIQYWGNLDSIKTRKAYPKLREFIFEALIARTDADFIALDKGEITARKVVDMLMQTMEEYANWGFHFMEDKMIDNPSTFFSDTAFLEIFLAMNTGSFIPEEEEEAESLD